MARDLRNINNICLTCFSTVNSSGICPTCRKTKSSVTSNPPALPVRTVLNSRYLISETLGVGGFGITYLAWDLMLSERVAIKEFFPKGYTGRLPNSTSVGVLQDNFTAAFNHWLNAFTREAQILTSIKHMHGVVKLKDFFKANNTAYIVMDYLEGVSLRKYVNIRGGKLTLKETLNIMRPVMDSLLLLHQYGIIHKDISPENIVVVRNKYVKLIDFGAASIFTQNIVKPYIVLKAGFSPIELYGNSMQQGPWSDIYQVGATIYNCLTGVIPPEAPSRSPYDPIIRPSAYGVNLPLIVENCIMRSLAVDPSARYDNMGKFIQILYGEFMPKI